MGVVSSLDFNDIDSLRGVTETQGVESTIAELAKKIQELGKLLETHKSVLAGHHIVDLTQLAKQVMPSTVQIQMMVTANTLYSGLMSNCVWESHASGFLISSDGYVVTNHHVVDGKTRMKVTCGQTGKIFNSKLIGSDPETDLALLKIEGEDFPYVCFADSDAVQVGQTAVLIGNPLGYKDILSLGVVGGKASGLENAYVAKWDQRDVGIYADYIIGDAVVNGGNSGGGLFNIQGDIIGICSRGGEGLGMHIASNTAIQVIEELMTKGYVTRSWLGAELVSVNDSLKELFHLGDISQPMLMIKDILKDSPAEAAGLHRGDVIVGYNDISITNKAKFLTDLAMRTKPGTELKLSILRQGEPLDVMVILGSREVNVTTSVDKLRIRIENLDNEKFYWCNLDSEIRGVLVSEVDIYSQTGLRPADVITGVMVNFEEIPVKNVDEFLKIMEEQKDQTVVLVVRSPDQSRPSYLGVKF